MQIEDKIAFDKYQWRILEIKAGAALLLTENIIGQRAFNNRTGDVTWADSEIRAYLNGDFYNSFDEPNRERIVAVINENPDNPWYGSKGGRDTRDHIFLLSLEETVCKYFGDSRPNLENRSPKQRYWFQKKDDNNQKRAAAFMGSGWWWWLRTPGRDNKRAVYIWGGSGVVGIQGNGTYRYSSNTLHPATLDNSGGLRPALWIKI